MLHTNNTRVRTFFGSIKKNEPSDECHHFVSKMPKKTQNKRSLHLQFKRQRIRPETPNRNGPRKMRGPERKMGGRVKKSQMVTPESLIMRRVLLVDRRVGHNKNKNKTILLFV